MSITTTEATTTKAGNGLAGIGAILTLLGLVAIAVPFLVLLYAQTNGDVQLSTADQINTLLTTGIVITIAALVLGALALICLVLATVRARRTGRIVGLVLALIVVVASAGFLVSTMLPRAAAIQHLNNKVVPFAQTLQANCQTPLNNTTAHLNSTLQDVQNDVSDDAGFAAAMQIDQNNLQNDATALTNGLNTLKNTTAPDAKYQPLLQDCVATVKVEVDFLTNDTGTNAIALPAPYSTLVPGGTVSGIDLLKDSALVASGGVPIHIKPGTIQPLVAFALQQVLAVTNPKLTQEGDQLVQDIHDTLNTNLAPFVVTVPVS